jgi:hypothetical protein
MVATINEGYVVDEGGKLVGIILSIDEYQKLTEAVEELESIRAYDAAKATGEEAIPFDQAVREIQQDRR